MRNLLLPILFSVLFGVALVWFLWSVYLIGMKP